MKSAFKSYVIAVMTILMVLLGMLYHFKKMPSQDRSPVSVSVIPVSSVNQLKTIALERGYLPMTVRAVPKCYRGDLDAIRLDLFNSRDKTLLLSVESLAGNKSPVTPMVYELNSDGNLDGFQAQFPLGSQVGEFGVFLCKDATHTHRCAGKKVEDIGAILVDYNHQGGHSWKESPPDRIYFFQNLIVQNNGVVSVFNDNRISEETFNRLGELLAGLTGKDKATFDDDLKSVKELTRTINSLALNTDSNSATIELPEFSRSACHP